MCGNRDVGHVLENQTRGFPLPGLGARPEIYPWDSSLPVSAFLILGSESSSGLWLHLPTNAHVLCSLVRQGLQPHNIRPGVRPF